jgi:hypothetical protein
MRRGCLLAKGSQSPGVLRVLPMKNPFQTSSQQNEVQQVAAELSRLFERQVVMTRREAFVGLTPEEREECDQITEGIRASYVKLAKLEAGHNARRPR